MGFEDEYISKKEAILAVTRDGCTANVVGVLYHLPTADVVPKSEVAREIFAEIEKITCRYLDDNEYSTGEMLYDLDELKKKYTEVER